MAAKSPRGILQDAPNAQQLRASSQTGLQTSGLQPIIVKLNMPQNKQKGSSNYAVEQIFGHYQDAFALDFFKKRLKTYCNETYLKRMPQSVAQNFASGVQRGKIIFYQAGYPYIENLLLLDALLNNNKLVMDIMGKDVPREQALERLNAAFKHTRTSLKHRLDLDLKVIESSASWDQLPENFDLGINKLSEHRSPSKSDSSPVSAPQAARFAAWERMREIDHDETKPENVAEKAFYLDRMGEHQHALSLIEDTLTEFPAHSLLHFVKAMVFMAKVQKDERQANLHDILHSEAEPLSGEELHHQEQYEQRLLDAAKGREDAVRALLNAYSNWPEHLPYDWFTNISPWELKDQVIDSILQNASYLPTLQRKIPQGLDEFLSDIVSGKGIRPITFSDRFQTLLKCMSTLIALQQDELLEELINKWLKQLTIDGLNCDDFIGFSGAFLIRERIPWKNPWIRLISGSNAVKVIEAALTNAKGQKDALTFVKFHIIQNQELQLDELLHRYVSRAWSSIAYAGSSDSYYRPSHNDVNSLLNVTQKRIQLCKQAIEASPWTDSSFSIRWKTRFEYMMARCHFDHAVAHLVNKATEPAAQALAASMQIRDANPEIGNKELSHFKIHNTDYDREYPESDEDYDLLAHTENIFADSVDNSLNPLEGLGFFYPEIYEDGYNDYYVPSSSPSNKAVDMLINEAGALSGTIYERVEQLIASRLDQ